ncbi:MAG: thiamine pyrophosphate-binding protein [Actinomycetota bacterium]|nr:thiamine pyrophosphate-binding protein [Actinomycetota bacterium]
MAKYRCTVCNYIYDEEKEEKKFSELPEDWRCPVCNALKSDFVLVEESAKDSKKATTVSDVLIEQLSAWGIEYVFGIPGTSSLGVIDAIRKNKKIKYIQVRHEQTAAFMASAYGKLTGNISACLTIAGPGATNLATGLYDAKLDHSPVLALTGLVKRQMMGPGSFQEIDQHSFFEPICVFNKVLMSEEQTTKLSALAIKHALVERGVSHISIPNDVQKLPLDTEIIEPDGQIPGNSTTYSSDMIEKSASIINVAERPVIISGFGAIANGDNLRKFAEKITAPIVTTFRGKGVVDENYKLCAGCHGGIGSISASKLVNNSDLLIVIGSSFSDMTQIPRKKMIQIDIDPMMIAKEFPVEAGLIGNSSELIPALTNAVKEKKNPNYLNEIRKLKKDWINQLEKESDSSKVPLRPQFIIRTLNKLIADDAVISLDVGENSWWFGRNFLMKASQKMVMSGYLASMGAGLPGALAAQLVFPDRQVICITGDGGFSMVMADFMTAVKYKLPVKIFLFNNRQLGMIMQEQKVENYPNWQTELHNCDFAQYAKNCGGNGIKVKKSSELHDAILKALKTNSPFIVDIDTDAKRF